MAFAPKRDLCIGTVQIDHGLVDESLLSGIQADDGFSDLCVHVLHRLQHALAQIALLVAVAQFNRFFLTCGRARRHGGTAHHTRFQQHVRFYGRVATGIQNLTRYDINNCTHSSLPSLTHFSS